jgi:hypothetical protein
VNLVNLVDSFGLPDGTAPVPPLDEDDAAFDPDTANALFARLTCVTLMTMMRSHRRLLAHLALAAALLATGCSNNSSPESTGAVKTDTASPTPAAAKSVASPTAKPSSRPAAKPSSSPPSTPDSTPSLRNDAVLTETFTSPDGTLSFRYPAGWTVTPTLDERHRDTIRKSWTLADAEGQSVLTLGLRTWEEQIGSAPLTTVLPQGPISGVLDGLGMPSQAIVAASPGQAVGATGGLHYGMAAGTGADTTLFSLRWGNDYLLSFAGGRELGPNTQVDLKAEAEQFAASPRFRNQILPIIESLTASSPPAPDKMTSNCVGARFNYQNLQGITCDEAKAILQTVLDTGRPLGARSQVTDDYECGETSYGEQIEGAPEMRCWARNDQGLRDHLVLEANYR